MNTTCRPEEQQDGTWKCKLCGYSRPKKFSKACSVEIHCLPLGDAVAALAMPIELLFRIANIQCKCKKRKFDLNHKVCWRYDENGKCQFI